ncbi:transcriptional regulator [Salinigranum rubrum]|uniref:Transcriptional regulator n=1 Tax=Salinigranum rubrum TaxID=755307 RepID=A0A2I8VL43_9EURY|nr:transcriptional regulator [Salinigranum rubrum]AUV82653.1 transcriptional regulator [Salinigranum rubrum]
MAELNRVAKRMYNVTPDPLRLTFDDDTTGVFELSSAEFFQQEFQAEGRRVDGNGTYRFTTNEDNTAVLVGRETADGWALVGEVVEAEAADGVEDAGQDRG